MRHGKLIGAIGVLVVLVTVVGSVSTLFRGAFDFGGSVALEAIATVLLVVVVVVAAVTYGARSGEWLANPYW